MNWFKAWYDRFTAKPRTTSDKADQWRRSWSRLSLRDWLRLGESDYDLWLRMGYAPVARGVAIIKAVNAVRTKPLQVGHYLPWLATRLANDAALGQIWSKDKYPHQGKMPYGLKNDEWLKSRLKDHVDVEIIGDDSCQFVCSYLLSNKATLDEAMSEWLSNPKHASIIQDENFGSIGACGNVYDFGKTVWCVILTGWIFDTP